MQPTRTKQNFILQVLFGAGYYFWAHISILTQKHKVWWTVVPLDIKKSLILFAHSCRSGVWIPLYTHILSQLPSSNLIKKLPCCLNVFSFLTTWTIPCIYVQEVWYEIIVFVGKENAVFCSFLQLQTAKFTCQFVRRKWRYL